MILINTAMFILGFAAGYKLFEIRTLAWIKVRVAQLDKIQSLTKKDEK
jgi:hypothetical protein